MKTLYDQPTLMASLAGLLLAVTAAGAPAGTYHYKAYLAGIPVGRASVVVEVDANRYRIRGTAAARGVASFFSDWRSEFYATGGFRNLGPELSTYGYDEWNRKKQRILRLADGIVSVTRNGQPRPPMTVLEGLDILTAFFIVPDCWANQLLHTGRYSYRVAGRADAESGACAFQVRDDDGDSTRLTLHFAEHDGRRVPARLSTGGLIRGWIVLTDIGTDDGPSIIR